MTHRSGPLKELEWMTTGQVARALGVTVPTVNRWIQENRLPSMRTPGGHYRIQRCDFLEFARKAATGDRRDPGRISILVVEDEQDLHKVILKNLEMLELPLDIRCCADGREAVDLIPALRPDLFLIDLYMPDLNGFELCGFIRGNPRTRDARILVMTGHGTSENVAAVEKVGANRILFKPFSGAELRSTVQELVDEIRGGASRPR